MTVGQVISITVTSNSWYEAIVKQSIMLDCVKNMTCVFNVVSIMIWLIFNSQTVPQISHGISSTNK